MLVSTYYVSYYVKIVTFKANISVKFNRKMSFSIFFNGQRTAKLVKTTYGCIGLLCVDIFNSFPPQFL